MSQLRVFGVSPDLVLVVIVTWVLVRDQPEGLLAAISGGAAVAALSGGPRLLIFLLFIICSTLVGYAHRHLPKLAGVIPYLSIVAATLLYKGVMIFWMQTTREAVYLPGLAVQVVLPAVLWNVILMVVVYQLAVWVDKRLGPPTVEWE